MMRSSWWLIPIVIVALLVGGGIGAVVADHHDRVVQISTQSGQSGDQPVQVVRVDDGRRWHWGFFPFGFLLFPLLWIGLIWLFWGGFWRRRGGWGRWDDRFEDWHRRQHEGNNRGGDQPSPPGAASA
jgi:hypothetical protein